MFTTTLHVSVVIMSLPVTCSVGLINSIQFWQWSQLGMIFVYKTNACAAVTACTKGLYHATLCVSAVIVVGWCLSVCPSVTLVYCIATANGIIKLFLGLMLTNPRDAFTPGMVSYYCSIETLSPTSTVFEIFAFSNTMTLKSGLKVTQGHWEWYHSTDCVWFPISVL